MHFRLDLVPLVPGGLVLPGVLLPGVTSQAIVAQGGTISHQHGVGIDHLPYLAGEKGELGTAAIRDLCRCFDPEGMMNPGKLV